MSQARLLRSLCLFALVMSLAASSVFGEAVVYRAQARAAEELAELVRPLVGDGSVTVDARTNSLVIAAEPGAIRRALAFLETVDVAPHRVKVTVRFIETDRLRQRNVEVTWSYADEAFRIGAVQGDPTRSRFEDQVSPGARHLTSRREEKLFLVIEEGGRGALTAGRSIPVTRWLMAYNEEVGHVVGWEGSVEVTTGFAVTPRVMDGGGVQLIIAPWARYLSEAGHQEIVYREARTTITVPAGGSVVLASGDSQAGRLVASMMAGFSDARSSRDWAMVLRAEVME